MPRPTNRTELLSRMDEEMSRLHDAVMAIPMEARTLSGACEEWSVKDLLAHLDAWHEMFLEWERDGSKGAKPSMPAPGFTWADTPALNQEIWEKTRNDEFSEVASYAISATSSHYDWARKLVAKFGKQLASS